jgi:hypothetical protein
VLVDPAVDGQIAVVTRVIGDSYDVILSQLEIDLYECGMDFGVEADNESTIAGLVS